MTMRSWQMTAVGEPMLREEGTIPEPGPGEVVVKVAGCGVCHTDLGFLYDGVRTKSPLPLTLGHEISGVVLSSGAEAGKWDGKAVVIPAVMPCGECDVCNRGLGNICRGQKMPGNDIQGGFASHVLVPAAGLCEVPAAGQGGMIGESEVSLAEFSVVADALTTPYQAIVESGLSAEDTAIFIGVGGVGGFGAQIAKAFGAAVVAIDVDQERLDALVPYVDLCLNAQEHPGRELKKAVSGFVKEQRRRPTEWKIFECSGTGAGQKTAFGLLTFGASLSVVGFTMEAPEFRLSNLMAFHATARGNWGCLPEYYPKVVELVASGKVKIAPFVQCFPLEEINAVFERVHKHEIKVRPVMLP